ncbi:MAG: hypothetical protein VCC00_08900 [Deltaproteobacteria bacterium]
MTKFLIGLLLGLILGAAGASGFLITAGGGDYFVGASPRVRELEASLREGQQERQWLRGRLSDATESASRLESRFLGLAARFEVLSDESSHPEVVARVLRTAPQPSTTPLAAMPTAEPTTADKPAEADSVRKDPT